MGRTMFQNIPDAKSLLAKTSDELAGFVIEHINALPANERTNLNCGNFSRQIGCQYGKLVIERKVIDAVLRAWQKLEGYSLLYPIDDHGFFGVSPEGMAMKDASNFYTFLNLSPAADRGQSTVRRRRIVISLHGIRTRGYWQKQLTIELNKGGFDHVPLDYGFFGAIQLVLPFMRDRKIKWFRKELEDYAGDRSNPPSVIAHSFGTYLVARALKKYNEVKFDRIIFCGSIVEKNYSWSTILNSGRATRVLNDFGGKDFWAKVAQWVVSDAGPSGAEGFSDDAKGRVIKLYRSEFRHSDFFYNSNYMQTWIPFLDGKDPDPSVDMPRRPPNLKFRIVLWLLTLVLVLGLVLAGYILRRV